MHEGEVMSRAGEDPGNWTHAEAVVNGVRLHYVEAGAGPLVILLHGFPEFWYSWRWQIPALAAAGHRVIAPDLRGYNLSDKPAGVRSYRLEALRGDVAGLIRQAGVERATVVGHDWGGAIAWTLALRRPELLDRLVILNAPHPAAFLRELRTWSQLRKSWYMIFFQLPLLPELVFRAGNFALLERTLRRDPVRPGAFSAADVEQYRRALARPGALTAAINYYRAAFRHDLRRSARPLPRIDVPTLLIWGEQDRYLGTELTAGLEPWVSNLRIERIAEASHWVQVDAPDKVNRLLIEFLGGQFPAPLGGEGGKASAKR
jgi:pimeloyl-ACP methyl ester carboxylesterase